MIIKLDNGYLEINELIEVEKKVKLFDDISTTEGDFSYSFSIPKTLNNVKIVSIYSVNDKPNRWSRKINADILSDSGISLHKGFLRIERDLTREYIASFFAGNTNWIDQLNYPLRDIGWEDITVPDPEDSWSNSSGIVFPLTDRGILSFRKSPLLSAEDFNAYIYVKDIINRLLTVNGMKMTGDLFEIPEYQKLITTASDFKFLNSEIAKRDAKVGKSSSQFISGVSFVTITFTDFTSPFYNSDNNNYSSGRYNFDIGVSELDIEFYIPLGTESNGTVYLRILKNGTTQLWEAISFPVIRFRGTINNLKDFDLIDKPNPGDYYELQLRSGVGRSVLAGAYFRVTPKRFKTAFATDTIPDMNGSDFISNIFRTFNIIASYNAQTKTITANKLDNVIDNDPIDISEYIEIDENDFQEVSADYFQNNLLVWGEQNNEETEVYNKSNQIPYGGGVINIDNEFLEDWGNIIEQDFIASYQQSYPMLGIDLVKTELSSAVVTDTRDITSVSNSGGYAVFNYSGSSVGTSAIVRIRESTVTEYNGDYYTAGNSGSTFNSAFTYVSNGTAKMDILSIEANSTDPILLLNNPNQYIPDVMGVEAILYDSLLFGYTNRIAVANFLSTQFFKGSLSFSDLVPRYFRSMDRLLNTGVKSFGSGNIPESVYNNIDFMNPVKINENEYFLQILSGYKGSKYSAQVEIIKK